MPHDPPHTHRAAPSEVGVDDHRASNECFGDLSQLIPSSRLPKLLPGRIHKSTVRRWWTRGVRGVQLQVVHIGRTPYTTNEWLEAFATASSPKGTSEPYRPRPSSRTQRKAATEARKVLGLDH